MNQPSDQIRVVLADDHPVVLAGIKALLQSAPEIKLVGEATNATDVMALVRALRPDIAVLDLSLPDLNGIEVAARIAKEAPSVRVIALTVHEDRAYVQPLLQTGAKGYVLKRSAADDLLRAVRAVAAGGTYLDPSVADKAIAPPSAPANSHDGALSPRESDVIRYAAQGFSNKEIAARLDVSVKTAETYKARACEKLGLRTRSEIVRFGATQGWLEDLRSSGHSFVAAPD